MALEILNLPYKTIWKSNKRNSWRQKMTREQELEQRYQDFQEWLNICPLVVTDYQDFTDQFQITFSLEAD